jgi:hypothetical protein
MRSRDQFRLLERLGICSLLCVAIHGIGIAQTEASASPKKPAATSKASSTKAKTSSTTKRASSKKSPKSSRGKKGSKKRGQQAIDSTRARQIQEALIREHYMLGAPTGTWDATTQAAMQKYQADQGWQSKTTPDSRALIKLGLGPSHDHLLNPESAMTTSTAPAATSNSKANTKPVPADNNLPQQ